MKTIFILLLTLSISNTVVATELDWVDEQIEAIKPPRKGVVVSGTNDPFVFLNKNKPKEEKKDEASTVVATTATKVVPVVEEKPPLTSEDFVLGGIFNSSAMINGSWYKKSDIVSEHIIFEIDKNFVTLKNKKGDRTILLSTATNKQTLKFKNK
ncbi:MAG: hypothetical protein OEL19_11000 [Sulfurimonas sp.]|nr:hypothetical protein [Sulfurimonas sp.]